mgnify:CR=1 FL=1|jgi:hypothetical protein
MTDFFQTPAEYADSLITLFGNADDALAEFEKFNTSIWPGYPAKHKADTIHQLTKRLDACECVDGGDDYSSADPFCPIHGNPTD